MVFKIEEKIIRPKQEFIDRVRRRPAQMAFLEGLKEISKIPGAEALTLIKWQNAFLDSDGKLIQENVNKVGSSSGLCLGHYFSHGKIERLPDETPVIILKYGDTNQNQLITDITGFEEQMRQGTKNYDMILNAFSGKMSILKFEGENREEIFIKPDKDQTIIHPIPKENGWGFRHPMTGIPCPDLTKEQKENNFKIYLFRLEQNSGFVRGGRGFSNSGCILSDYPFNVSWVYYTIAEGEVKNEKG